MGRLQLGVAFAALAKHRDLTIATSDLDFEALPEVRVENWLA